MSDLPNKMVIFHSYVMLVCQRVWDIPTIGEYLHFLSPYLDDILVNIYLFVSSAQFRPIRTTKNRLGRSKSDRLGRLGLISRGERFAKKKWDLPTVGLKQQKMGFIS